MRAPIYSLSFSPVLLSQKDVHFTISAFFLSRIAAQERRLSRSRRLTADDLALSDQNSDPDIRDNRSDSDERNGDVYEHAQADSVWKSDDDVDLLTGKLSLKIDFSISWIIIASQKMYADPLKRSFLLHSKKVFPSSFFV